MIRKIRKFKMQYLIIAKLFHKIKKKTKPEDETKLSLARQEKQFIDSELNKL